MLLPIQSHQRAGLDHHLVQAAYLFVSSITPVNLIGGRLSSDPLNPLLQTDVVHS
jgi:hypothetical protein